MNPVKRRLKLSAVLAAIALCALAAFALSLESAADGSEVEVSFQGWTNDISLGRLPLFLVKNHAPYPIALDGHKFLLHGGSQALHGLPSVLGAGKACTIASSGTGQLASEVRVFWRSYRSKKLYDLVGWFAEMLPMDTVPGGKAFLVTCEVPGKID